MRFLIICSATEPPDGVLGGPVLYRPDLGTADDVTLAEALRAERPHALVTDRALGPDPLREWRRAMPDDPVVIVRCGRSRDGDPTGRPDHVTATATATADGDGDVPGDADAHAVAYGVPVLSVAAAPVPDGPGTRGPDEAGVPLPDATGAPIIDATGVRIPDGLPDGGAPVIPPGIAEETLVRALGAAERFLQRRARPARPPGTASRTGPRPPTRPETVLLVGAGVVNLVTAQRLRSAGYEVSVVEAGPDPRAGAPWHTYGTSRGGGNARMFTLTEMDDYHAKSPSDTASPSVFDRPPDDDCGWDVRRRTGPAPDATAPGPLPAGPAPDATEPGSLPTGPLPTGPARAEEAAARADAETAWVRDFKSVPPWLARTYNEDIFALNRRGERLWRRWIDTRPDLFADVRLSHGILRLYEDAGHLEESARRQDHVGATLARYGSEEVRERFPALAGAVPDAYAGGIMVRGFTLTVHDFLAALLDSLQAGGARLHFDCRADRILRTRHGDVSGVVTPYGVHRADHYVVSPGVTGGALARDVGALGQVQGVLGCWASLPDLAPGLGHSLKVGRRGHLTEDANITLGRDETGDRVLIVGSGYGWTGGDPENIDERHLDLVHAALADTARRLFPAAYEAGGGEEGLRASRRHCVRPWTATNLGLFDLAPAEDGVMVLTGGHNTGGFAQAPVIAEAVLSALRGLYHPMHTLYHPDRGHRVLGPPAPDPRERQASQ
ncbi:FAD dependent oxidoreductase [Streptomyces laurentii]|uniref:FAD dependent oxidoreductase n=1 Tax=Streptomyces laurentii TaxID=39478 RepID=A0A160NY99_STRLU|nr:FAD dependent oxidoreductase [Streptomyces laurentii]